MAPQPTVSFLNGATLDSLIGTQVTTTLRFDNTASGTDVGYAPFINLILPTNGADGPGAGNSPVNDGVTFVSAQYLGADLEVVSREFPTSGVVNHPFAKLPSGAPMTVTGTPGTTLLVLKLPFGSFTTTQTPANIELKLNISNLADLNAPLPIQATAGFAFGADALDNTAADPVILGTATTQTLNPTVAKLDKIYSGPEQETATGPSYERIWQVQANFAPGQPFTNVTLTDRVPDGVIIVGTPRLHDGAGNVLPGSVSVTGLYGSQVITAVFDGTIIGGAVKPTLEFNWYVTEFLSTGAPVLDPDDGTFHPLLNDAKLVSSWNPIDGRDPITSTTIDPAGPEDIVTAKSIAIQKGVALVNGDADSNGVPDWQPGGTLQYTLAGQVSNYFEMKELNVYDTLGDGQTFNAGFTPTIVIREGGVPIYTGPVQYTLDAKGTDGKTPVTFHVSNTLIANGQDGVLDGNGGVLGDVPHATDYNQATVLITFQSTLDMNWTGPVPGDDRVDQGDRVGNTADFGGDVFLTEIERRDDSSAGVSLPINDIGKSINVDKSIYAINGDTSQGTNSLAIKPLIQAGDLVTYRIKLDIPLTSSHDVTLKDFLPLPVFLANDPDANGVASGFTYAGITNTPGAGEWSLMTSDQLRINAPGVIAGVSVTQDAVGNSVLWNFGDIINNAYPRTLLDMLFTVRVNDSPLGDGLLLTNQVTITETNSFNAVFEENDIIQFVLGEPRLKITKGVVAENNTAAGYTVNATTNGSEVGPAGVTWNAPGSATPFSGTITSAGLASRPVDADLFQADARDTVTFAVVLENIGSASRGAFDTLIRDTIPTGFTLGAVPLNLNVVDGTGATVAYTGAPADLFTTGIELLDPDARQGAVGAFSLTSGKNIVVITYDLRLDDNVPVMERLVNTATTADYAAEEGGENRTATDNLPDSNTAFVEITPKIGKEVIASSNPDTGNTEGNDDFADLTIGETVTWRVTVTVPEGVSKNLTIRDVLPGGVGASTSGPFELVSVTTATVGSNITGSGVLAGSTGVISNSNGDAWMDTVVFSFGDVTNAPDNVENAADQISFDITASVLDTPGNVRGQTETNIATVSVTDSMGAVKNTSVTSSVELVEPQLAITKSVANLTQPSLTNAGTGNASGDANDVFLYTVRLQNRGGDA
ncbi:MAG: hypothetical protein NTW56_02245, partial [Alphaproteobacteria bacterium]|nr:hypothetical protein [Alphaproteobacteria bacterium]